MRDEDEKEEFFLSMYVILHRDTNMHKGSKRPAIKWKKTCNQMGKKIAEDYF